MGFVKPLSAGQKLKTRGADGSFWHRVALLWLLPQTFVVLSSVIYFFFSFFTSNSPSSCLSSITTTFCTLLLRVRCQRSLGTVASRAAQSSTGARVRACVWSPCQQPGKNRCLIYSIRACHLNKEAAEEEASLRGEQSGDGLEESEPCCTPAHNTCLC